MIGAETLAPADLTADPEIRALPGPVQNREAHRQRDRAAPQGDPSGRIGRLAAVGAFSQARTTAIRDLFVREGRLAHKLRRILVPETEPSRDRPMVGLQPDVAPHRSAIIGQAGT